MVQAEIPFKETIYRQRMKDENRSQQLTLSHCTHPSKLIQVIHSPSIISLLGSKAVGSGCLKVPSNKGHDGRMDGCMERHGWTIGKQ